ncbi:twin-arginine translocation signal domain-containing protein [bacterium]|nr:twin-arginine translocation signal domain-containing protein [bacterium]
MPSISRRSFIQTACSAAAAISMPKVLPSAEAKRPNIVMLYIDH